MTSAHLVETGSLKSTTVLLLPLKGEEMGKEIYWDYLRGKFDLSRDVEMEGGETN